MRKPWRKIRLLSSSPPFYAMADILTKRAESLADFIKEVFFRHMGGRALSITYGHDCLLAPREARPCTCFCLA